MRPTACAVRSRDNSLTQHGAVSTRLCPHGAVRSRDNSLTQHGAVRSRDNSLTQHGAVHSRDNSLTQHGAVHNTALSTQPYDATRQRRRGETANGEAAIWETANGETANGEAAIWETVNKINNNNVNLSCAHQRPERSHDTY